MEFKLDLPPWRAQECSEALTAKGYVTTFSGNTVTVVTNEPGQLVADLYDSGFTIRLEDLKV